VFWYSYSVVVEGAFARDCQGSGTFVVGILGNSAGGKCSGVMVQVGEGKGEGGKDGVECA
jgi:hypothetical protein